VQVGGVLHLGELPGPHGGRTEVAGLAGLDDVVKGFHRLLDRGRGVETVDLVEVDVLRAEPGQRGVDVLHDRLAGQAGSAGTTVHREVHLGGQDDLLAARVLLDGSTDDLF
jgi:hypothetical protein